MINPAGLFTSCSRVMTSATSEIYCNKPLLVHANFSRLWGYKGRGLTRTDSIQRSDKNLAYLCWVSRLKCPYNNCRKQGFQSEASFHNHVSNCAQSLEASYWCPYCDQMEQLGIEEFQDGSFAATHSNKGPRVKRAGGFFKRFRCTDSRHISRGLHCRDIDVTEFPAGLETEPRPKHPENPDDIGYTFLADPEELCELGAFWGRASGGRSETVSKPVRNFLPYADENGRDSGFPTKQEVGISNPKYLGTSNPSIVSERAELSSHCSVNSQRKSSTGLRFSTSAASVENGPAVHDQQQIRVSHAEKSKTSAIHSIHPGSFPVGSSGSPRLNSDPRFTITDGRILPDGVDVSPLSPKSLRPSGQIKHGLISPMTPCSPFLPGNVQELEAKQCVSRKLHRSDDDSGARNIAEQQIPDFSTTSAHLHQLLRTFKKQWKGYSDDGLKTCSLLVGLNNPSMLNDGLEALAQYFTGNPPVTLGGVLALVQFAYACAGTCHHQKTLHVRSSFFQNALRWGERITDLQDRCRFYEIANLLWQAPLHYESHYLNYTSDLQSSLKSGTVIDSCVHFLDGRFDAKK